jgi:hypothetical protein
MNKDTIERWILLRQSGELGPIRSRWLARALARDPAARRFADDAQRLTNAARAWSAAQPAPHTLDAIRARAREIPDRRDALVMRPHPALRILRPAFAGAFALMLLALLINRNARRDDPIAPIAQMNVPTVEAAWDDGLDAEIDALFEAVSFIESDAVEEESAALEEEHLIREWLLLKGIAI